MYQNGMRLLKIKMMNKYCNRHVWNNLLFSIETIGKGLFNIISSIFMIVITMSLFVIDYIIRFVLWFGKLFLSYGETQYKKLR